MIKFEIDEYSIDSCGLSEGNYYINHYYGDIEKFEVSFYPTWIDETVNSVIIGIYNTLYEALDAANEHYTKLLETI